MLPISLYSKGIKIYPFVFILDLASEICRGQDCDGSKMVKSTILVTKSVLVTSIDELDLLFFIKPNQTKSYQTRYGLVYVFQWYN